MRSWRSLFRITGALIELSHCSSVSLNAMDKVGLGMPVISVAQLLFGAGSTATLIGTTRWPRRPSSATRRQRYSTLTQPRMAPALSSLSNLSSYVTQAPDYHFLPGKAVCVSLQRTRQGYKDKSGRRDKFAYAIGYALLVTELPFTAGGTCRKSHLAYTRVYMRCKATSCILVYPLACSLVWRLSSPLSTHVLAADKGLPFIYVTHAVELPSKTQLEAARGRPDAPSEKWLHSRSTQMPFAARGCACVARGGHLSQLTIAIDGGDARSPEQSLRRRLRAAMQGLLRARYEGRQLMEQGFRLVNGGVGGHSGLDAAIASGAHFDAAALDALQLFVSNGELYTQVLYAHLTCNASILPSIEFASHHP